jgi:hypothetical protein
MPCFVPLAHDGTLLLIHSYSLSVLLMLKSKLLSVATSHLGGLVIDSGAAEGKIEVVWTMATGWRGLCV